MALIMITGSQKVANRKSHCKPIKINKPLIRRAIPTSHNLWQFDKMHNNSFAVFKESIKKPFKWCAVRYAELINDPNVFSKINWLIPITLSDRAFPMQSGLAKR